MSPGQSRPILQLERVNFRYEGGPLHPTAATDVLKEIDLEVAVGETLGLVGESGSGKTTLGRVSLGLRQPTSGQVLFDGEPLRSRRRRALRGQLQIVLQTPEWSLNPRLRCGTSIGEPLAIERQGNRDARRKRVEALLEQVGLPAEIASRYPHELSGGQLQRVAIARSLSTTPRLLVLDEVVSALDVSVQAQILNLLKTLQHVRRFSAIFISHDLAVVRYVSHRIAVMYKGTLVEIAPARAFYGRTSHPYTRALLAAHATTSDERFRLADEDGGAQNAGCVLAGRCPLSTDRCKLERPLLRPVGDSLVACHRAEEVAALEMTAEP